ncbi:hypothetical protein Bbelb_251780 [Branchiostoma belcheri]|nr:hypothetical protein Bbelb_251780 [Branchiostoma belcheri]
MGRSRVARVKRSARANLEKLQCRIRKLRDRLFQRRKKKQNDDTQAETESDQLRKTVESLQQDLETTREQLGYQTLKTATIAEDRDTILRHQAVRFAAERAGYQELFAELGIRLSQTVALERQIVLLQKRVHELGTSQTLLPGCLTFTNLQNRVRELERGQTLRLLKASEAKEGSGEPEKAAQPRGDAKDAGSRPWEDYVTRPRVIKSGSAILQQAKENFLSSNCS